MNQRAIAVHRDHGTSRRRSEFGEREGCQRHPKRKWYPTLVSNLEVTLRRRRSLEKIDRG
jgi:hypothetical protein